MQKEYLFREVNNNMHQVVLGFEPYSYNGQVLPNVYSCIGLISKNLDLPEKSDKCIKLLVFFDCPTWQGKLEQYIDDTILNTYY